MRAIAVILLATFVTGCEKEKGEDLLARLPYWKWVHSEKKDDFTDVVSRSSVLKSGPISDGNEEPVEMHFRCTAGKMDFYLSWNRRIESDSLVDIRVDSDPHEPNKWEPSTDRKSTFYPFLTPPFLDRLAASKSFIARASTLSGEITAKFDTSKVLEETKEVRAACKF
ncbi:MULTISPECIES: hypothetical protein [unclassified Pseudomonas]|uniref:hypothetical protein n=1 Tax=unclassified Pseudomonas TaxID=196821 RepID=UPI001473804D|nr:MULTISPECIES: hypothetical protein [unclassified Pseudomonas]NMX88251.1 hypothetical protein [Pseudomonas sp. WS 5010]NMY23775.1 hypothetical protein [Pseudomonas sp. WS 5410]